MIELSRPPRSAEQAERATGWVGDPAVVARGRWPGGQLRSYAKPTLGRRQVPTRELMSTPSLVTKIAALQDYQRYEDLHWSGTFEEYLDMVRQNPRIARTSH